LFLRVVKIIRNVRELQWNKIWRAADFLTSKRHLTKDHYRITCNKQSLSHPRYRSYLWASRGKRPTPEICSARSSGYATSPETLRAPGPIAASALWAAADSSSSARSPVTAAPASWKSAVTSCPRSLLCVKFWSCYRALSRVSCARLYRQTRTQHRLGELRRQSSYLYLQRCKCYCTSYIRGGIHGIRAERTSSLGRSAEGTEMRARPLAKTIAGFRKPLTRHQPITTSAFDRLIRLRVIFALRRIELRVQADRISHYVWSCLILRKNKIQIGGVISLRVILSTSMRVQLYRTNVLSMLPFAATAAARVTVATVASTATVAVALAFTRQVCRDLLSSSGFSRSRDLWDRMSRISNTDALKIFSRTPRRLPR